MIFFRKTNKQILLLGSLLLSLALLCAQGVTLHTHDITSHDTKHHNNEHLQLDHKHSNKTHLAHDDSHEHHGSITSVLNITPEGLLKSTSNHVLFIVLFSFFIIFTAFSTSQQFIHHYRKNKLNLRLLHTLSPPLRAPPQ